MKTRICLFLLLLSCCILSSKETTTSNVTSQEGSINVFSSPDLYPLTMQWAGEYGSLNPKLKINVIKSSDKEISETLNSGAGIGFIADQSLVSIKNQHCWNMVIGRDVIVPVMNAQNPFRDEIYRKGVTPGSLVQILENPENHNWGMFAGIIEEIPNVPIHFYMFEDASINLGIGNFLHTNRLSNLAIKTANGQEMISAIQKDPNGLGFCRLIQIIDPQNQNMAANISLVPIDKNGNGKIDYMENIYDNLQSFSRGVWIGKYPRALTGNLYSVSSVKPNSATELAFLKWVITDGQQFLNANGYSDLALIERNSQLDKINEPESATTAPENEIYALGKMLLLVLFVLGLTGLILEAAFRPFRNKKGIVPNTTADLHPVFDENSVIIPKGLYFDKTHTWAFMKKDGNVKIGVDDFLQHITGKLTRIEMRDPGEKIKKGDRLLSIIRNGKQLDIYSPVSGTITGKNETLITNSSLINTSPYTDGWVCTIEPTNWLLEIQFLTMAEKYKTWLKDEFMRLKDFFATALKTNTPEYALIVLQDGGALKDSILADLGPEVWDDFQTKFIDVSR